VRRAFISIEIILQFYFYGKEVPDLAAPAVTRKRLVKCRRTNCTFWFTVGAGTYAEVGSCRAHPQRDESRLATGSKAPAGNSLGSRAGRSGLFGRRSLTFHELGILEVRCLGGCDTVLAIFLGAPQGGPARVE